MSRHWEHIIGGLGLVLLVIGNYMGLFASPPEEHMREVVRILYVHVPAAWVAMLVLTFAFVTALGHLFTNKPVFDWWTEANVEVGTVLTALLILEGSIFARPTWGVWWDWDPRLTSSAVMLVTFVGVILLRQALHDPERRATWTSVAVILSYVNVPITYFSVRWWRSLHQLQSSRETVSGAIADVLMLNTVAFTLIAVWFVVRRYRLAKALAAEEQPPPLPEIAA